MTSFDERIRSLAREGRIRTSDHAYGRLLQKDISYRALLALLEDAEIIERYPDYRHGPCFLARHAFGDGRVAHAVWGLPEAAAEEAVLVTAYWPDERDWDEELRARR